MSQTVVLKVKMSCQGCAGAVQRALGKMEGVESTDIDLKEQKVTVKGNVEPQTVFETVSKTGKSTSFWEEPVPVPAPESAPTLAPETDQTPAPETTPAPAPETPPAPTPEPAPAAEVEAKPAEPVSAA